MTNLLRKLFIKDFNNVNDPKVRTKHGFLASFVGAFTNLLLFVFKLLIGLLTISLSIITDAINNLTDMASCIVNLVGFKLANKPADKKHPFGHERIEYLAGMIISLIIIIIAVFLGYSSVLKIINKEDAVPNIWSLIILSVAILAKLWQGFFYKKMSNLINSVSLKASSQDSFNDVITTICVLIAAIVQFFLQKYEVNVPFSIDGVVGIALALFIVIMGIKLVIETANPLIGITPDHELVQSIVDDILNYKGVLGVHDLMCHSYGPTKIFMTIHVEVDSKVDVMESHDLMDNIEMEVGTKHNVILTVHMDPIDTSSPLVIELKEKVNSIITNYNSQLSFHDFRIVNGNTHTNILFDVVVPYELNINNNELKQYLIDELKKIDETYNLVVKFDSKYID